MPNVVSANSRAARLEMRITAVCDLRSLSMASSSPAASRKPAPVAHGKSNRRRQHTSCKDDRSELCGAETRCRIGQKQREDHQPQVDEKHERARQKKRTERAARGNA